MTLTTRLTNGAKARVTWANQSRSSPALRAALAEAGGGAEIDEESRRAPFGGEGLRAARGRSPPTRKSSPAGAVGRTARPSAPQAASAVADRAADSARRRRATSTRRP